MQVKPNFNMAQNAATAFLNRQLITGLIFKPRTINLIEDGIIIDTISNYARLTGQRRECFIARNVDNCYTFESDGLNIILYDETCSSLEHTDFGISHELGHIYCCHTHDGATEEIEANFFAAQLLMPKIVCYYIMKHYLNHRINAWDLMDIFNVSLEAASKRINTFKRKNSFNSSKKDYALLEKYKPFIQRFFERSIDDINETDSEYEMIV